MTNQEKADHYIARAEKVMDTAKDRDRPGPDGGNAGSYATAYATMAIFFQTAAAAD